MKKPATAAAALLLPVLISSCYQRNVYEEAPEPVSVAETEQPEPAGPTQEEISEFVNFVVSEGMPRAEVEAVLGEPDHVGRLKTGELFVLYELAARWKSVAYDDLGRAIIAYPEFNRLPDTDQQEGPDLEAVPENPALPKGALSGASIFVNPGHGWIYSSRSGNFTTQRGLRFGMIEDHSNAEAVLQFLVPYLENTGARVYVARERNLNPNMVIVDSEDSGMTLEGAWDTVQVQDGWKGVVHTAETSTGAPTATATFTPDIPEDGHYAVYAWYRPAVDGTTSVKTTFEINHSGGSSWWVQNQNHDTRTWTYLGTYHFEEGSNGSLVLTNATGAEEQNVVISAVRFGGGTDRTTVRDGVVMEKPRFEVSGLYTSQFMGFHPQNESRTFNSVSAMPMWAEWEAEPYEYGKSVYLSWHTNASAEGRSRGLSSFIYGPDAWGGLDRFTGVPGGLELCRTVHEEIIGDVRAAIEPDWRDIGTITRWLGETNPRNNNKMPAALFEYGFHDNEQDAALIVDPQFRNTCARATMQGVVKFFAEQMDGFEIATLPPEPPTELAVRLDSDNKIAISWAEPPHRTADNNLLGDAAADYTVQVSPNGKGFSDIATGLKQTFFTMEAPAGELVYVRVLAHNEGGRSMPTEVLAASRPAPTDRGRVLFINAFDRLDKEMNLQYESGLTRGILERMNTFDYVIQHAEALRAAGYGVDSVSDEMALSAIRAGAYDAVVWNFGQENTLGDKERRALEATLAEAPVMLSGSEIAPQLGSMLPLEFRAGAEVSAVLYEGKRFPLSERDAGPVYPARNLTTFDSENPVMRYAGGEPAAIIITDQQRPVAFLGFPFETISQEQDRVMTMGTIMSALMDSGK